jgi:hypothetical protein
VINATIELDAAFATTGSSGCTKCSAIRIDESGLAYGKPIDCSFAPFPEGIDCLAKEGRLMYDGMAVFVATSVPLSSQNVKLDRDIANRAIYNISVPLTAGTATPLVLGWVMGDDTTSTRARIAKYMTPAAAAAALAARTAEALDFLTTKVPQLHVTLDKSKVMVDQRVRKAAAVAAAKAATFNYTAGYTCTTGNYLFLRDQTEATCEKACAADVNCVEFKLKLTAPFWCTLTNASGASPPRTAPGYGCGCKGSCPGPSPGPGPAPGPGPLPNTSIPIKAVIYARYVPLFQQTKKHAAVYVAEPALLALTALERYAIDSANGVNLGEARPYQDLVSGSLLDKPSATSPEGKRQPVRVQVRTNTTVIFICSLNLFSGQHSSLPYTSSCAPMNVFAGGVGFE